MRRFGFEFFKSLSLTSGFKASGKPLRFQGVRLKTRSLRHPSQLYEALFEGIVLFILLWLIRKKKMFDGFLIGIYFCGYGLVRFFIEFFREPDYQLGFVLGFMSMGQVLCSLMMIAGITIIVWRKQVSILSK